jgi:hypothetical protein
VAQATALCKSTCTAGSAIWPVPVTQQASPKQVAPVAQLNPALKQPVTHLRLVSQWVRPAEMCHRHTPGTQREHLEETACSSNPTCPTSHSVSPAANRNRSTARFVRPRCVVQTGPAFQRTTKRQAGQRGALVCLRPGWQSFRFGTHPCTRASS